MAFFQASSWTPRPSNKEPGARRIRASGEPVAAKAPANVGVRPFDGIVFPQPCRKVGDEAEVEAEEEQAMARSLVQGIDTWQEMDETTRAKQMTRVGPSGALRVRPSTARGAEDGR